MECIGKMIDEFGWDIGPSRILDDPLAGSLESQMRRVVPIPNFWKASKS